MKVGAPMLDVTLKEVEDLSSVALAEKIFKEVLIALPEKCDTVEDLNRIANILPSLTTKYSYLMSLEAFIKAMNREEKRAGNKEKVADLVDKAFIVHSATECVKTQQKTLSRLITVKQMVNDEINMY